MPVGEIKVRLREVEEVEDVVFNLASILRRRNPSNRACGVDALKGPTMDVKFSIKDDVLGELSQAGAYVGKH